MSHLVFEHPLFFLLMLLIGCLLLCPIAITRHPFVHTIFFQRSTRFMNIERLIYALIMALIISALATPFYFEQSIMNSKKGRDLVMAIDASGSMAQSGFSNEDDDRSRFALIKTVMRTFIANRYDDNVGVSIFGTFGYAAVPLTYDMQAIKYLLDFINVGIAGENTAIGEGLMQALRILDHGKAKHKVIILLTDGYANSGQVSVAQAVQEAIDSGVKIYTIGIGDPKSYDADLLKKIAAQTGALSFSATDTSALEAVYAELDTLEPSPIKSANYLNVHQLFYIPATIAALLLVVVMRRKGML